MRPRVLLADDHTLILEGFRLVLGAECDLVGSVQDGQALVRAALDLKPDVVLMDIGMPLLNGIEAARAIQQALPRARIIFVTMHANPSYLRAALRVGASGYVLKTSARDELLIAVQRVVQGERYISRELAGVVAGPGPEPAEQLTPRQRQILQLIAEGRTAKEMASALHVSVQTVAFHKYRLMNKLSLRTTAELTRFALQEGIAAS